MQMRAIHSITPRFHGGFVDGRRGCVIHCVHCVQGKRTNVGFGERWRRSRKEESEFLLEFSNLILEGISLQMKEACFDLLSSL